MVWFVAGYDGVVMDFPPPEDFCSYMLRKMFELYQKQSFCDLAINVDNVDFNVHKCVFVAACPKLHEVIEEQRKESSDSVSLTFSGLSSAGFRLLVEYLYSGVAPKNLKNDGDYEDFLKACRVLGISELAIKSNLDEGDCHVEINITTDNEDLQLTNARAKRPYNKRSGKMHGRPPKAHDHIFPLDPPYTCPNTSCNREFSDRLKLKKHYRNHNEKTFKCDLCKKSFLYKKDLVVHMRIHTGEKPFCCEICSAKFAQKSTLTNHMESHEQVKNNMCEVCGKKYTLRRSLLLHKKEKHSIKLAKYQCFCGKTYTNQGSYMHHMRSECNGTSYLCPECGKQYRREEPYKKHIENCTGTIQFICDVCSRHFKSKTNLKHHIESFHSIIPFISLERRAVKPDVVSQQSLDSVILPTQSTGSIETVTNVQQSLLHDLEFVEILPTISGETKSAIDMQKSNEGSLPSYVTVSLPINTLRLKTAETKARKIEISSGTEMNLEEDNFEEQNHIGSSVEVFESSPPIVYFEN